MGGYWWIYWVLIRGLGYRNMFIAIEIDGGNQRYDIHFCIIICTNCYATFDFDHFYFLVLMFFVNYIINLFNVYVQTILIRKIICQFYWSVSFDLCPEKEDITLYLWGNKSKTTSSVIWGYKLSQWMDDYYCIWIWIVGRLLCKVILFHMLP